jgi:hypothetical protein
MVRGSIGSGVSLVLGSVAAVVVGSLGCSKDFSGPYPCNPGFVSCDTSNSCETNVTNDPQNCGACHNACPVAAVCTTGTCSASPTALTTDDLNDAFAINATHAFFPLASSMGQFDGVSKQGGGTFQVAMQNPGDPGVLAADNSNVYYTTMDPGGGTCPVIAASPAAPLDGGSPSDRMLGSLPANQCGFGNSVSSMVVVGPTLFLVTVNGSAQVVDSVPTVGGTMISQVTTFTSPNDIAFDSNSVYAIVTSGPCEIDRAPSAGGAMPSPFVSSNDLNSSGGCPTVLATDGTTVYWASDTTANPNNDNSGAQECILSVGGRPADLSAGTPTTRSSVVMDEAPLRMATDGTSVYVVTNASLWRFPTGGGQGSPVRLAGNLGVGMGCGNIGGPSGGCTFNGCSAQTQIGLAIDDTSVYLAVGAPMGGSGAGTLYKIPK